MEPVESRFKLENGNTYHVTEHKSAAKHHVLTLSPAKVAWTLFSIVAFLLVAHIAALYLNDYNKAHTEWVRRFHHFFDFNIEGNVPTYFSYSILLAAAMLLFIIYKLTAAKSPDRKYWLLLSFAFLFISLDEAIQIHERLNAVTRYFIKNDLSGLLYWAWVLPYTLLLLVLGLYLFRFILRLPVRTRNMFLLAGAVFFMGAVGIEMLEGYFIKTDILQHTQSKLIYAVTTTAQELLEMCGVIIFIYELLRYLVTHFQTISFEQPSYQGERSPLG